ncbi:MAG: sigma-70 family RNA polymerase sigma factor [Betaproteobacteria bacterium]|jgi:RNA polymerase sigma-70 factor (ECF subfamily)|nr:MAG: sigma-70 family RNA polymerase sigma factor [Betaproteobacteria bacterium]
MDERGRRFEQLVAPHLGAAFNFARWLTHNDHDAQDIVQDASLRALRFLDGLRGEDARPWLLGIVRNATWSWLQANRPSELTAREDDGEPQVPAPSSDEPETSAIRRAEARLLNEAITALPPPLREVIVLRELEDLAYRQIAHIAGIPIGTVMSRLARARRLLSQSVKVIEAAADRQGAR